MAVRFSGQLLIGVWGSQRFLRTSLRRAFADADTSGPTSKRLIFQTFKLSMTVISNSLIKRAQKNKATTIYCGQPT